MCTDDQMTGSPARRDFSLPLGYDLPPLPGTASDDGCMAPLLARHLRILVDVAGCTTIPPPARKPDASLVDELELVARAARSFDVGQGIGLAEVLWTRSGPYWKGEISEKLREIRVRSDKGEPVGFVLLVAQSVGRKAALMGHAQPFVVTGEIIADTETCGPYLALVVCELDPLGRAQAASGFAQPIISATCFMPVASAFERDVFLALMALQRTLDAHGLECTISRAPLLANGNLSRLVDVVVADELNPPRRLSLEVAEDNVETDPAISEGPAYVVTPARFADGSFVAWLESEITSFAPTPAAGTSQA